MQIPIFALFCINFALGSITFFAALVLGIDELYLPAMIHTGIAGMLLFPAPHTLT